MTDAPVSMPVRPRYLRYRRDGVLAVGGLALVVLGGLVRSMHLADGERDVFEAVNHLSGSIHVPLEVVMMLGTLLAVPAIALVAILFRRVRLAMMLLLGGWSAYGVTRIAKLLVEGGRPLDVLPHVDVIVRGAAATGLGYPSGHSAVSMALVLILIPYAIPRGRWWLLLLPAIVGFARMYVGAHLPLDVLGGWGIGVACAFTVHLIAGRPPIARDEHPGPGGPEPEVRERIAVSAGDRTVQ